jgi:hypothetical protein
MIMNRIHITPIIGLACLAVLSSCRKSHWKNDAMKKAISTTSFANPHMTCDACRVDDSYPGERKIQDGEELHGYAIISDAVTLPFKSQKELSSIIGNPNTYFRHSTPIDCLFRPDVAFRFNNKKTRVDLLVCFTCNELRYYLDGKIVGQSYFKSQKLRALVKGVFPKDKEIQSLKN